MALQTFDDYLLDVLELAKKIEEVNTEAAEILERHTSGGLGDVTDFAGRPMTETQYDGLITSFGNFAGYWGSPGFNGTNIIGALVEKP